MAEMKSTEPVVLPLMVSATKSKQGLWHSLESRVRRASDPRDKSYRPGHGHRITAGSEVERLLGFGKRELAEHFERLMASPEHQGKHWGNKQTKTENNPQGLPTWVLEYRTELNSARNFADILRLSQLDNLQPRWR